MNHIVYNQSSPEETFFYLINKQLAFTYNNGVDVDPRFSSRVEAEVFLNNNNDFVLKIRPLRSKWHQETIFREIVLIKDVLEVSYEFYYPNPNNSLEVEAEEIKKEGPPYGYSIRWDKEYKLLPHSLKLDVIKKIQDKTISLTFPLILCNS
jgi:hypothetical protein